MKVLLLLSILLFFCTTFHFESSSALPVSNFVETGAEENDIPHVVNNHELCRYRGVVDDVKYILTHMLDFLKIRELIKSVGKRAELGSWCVSCKFVTGLLQELVRNGGTEDDVGSIVYKVCTFFRIQTPEVCDGLTKLFKKEVTYLLVNVALSPKEVCGILLNGCGQPVNPLHNWTIPLTPFPKPPVIPPRTPKPNDPVTHVLHISDVHVDPYYEQGSNANCGSPLCCRAAYGAPSRPSDAAGYWGDYRNCDIPLRTFKNALAHINKTHKFDYVIMTGDIPPHDIWNNTRKEALDLLLSAVHVIREHLGNVPIFPALGNHESSPVNSFPIPQIKGNQSISWLYDEVSNLWSRWIPDSEKTIKLGAYYSVKVNDGLRLISLNMNYCNVLNWWILLNSTDPANELEWLVYQLQLAEIRGEKVHIIGHIPPGVPDCIGVWSYNYNRIINRYESTVTAQFFAHTHTDEFEIFYDKSGDKSRATNIAYIGPSITTYDGVNPGYRIYTVDGNYPESSRVVLDHETYYLNLTEANMYKKAKWQLEYSAKKDLGMTSLLPADWDLLTHRFQEDDQLFQKFYRFYTKMSDFYPNKCDKICKKEFICKLRRSQSNDPLIC